MKVIAIVFLLALTGCVVVPSHGGWGPHWHDGRR
jgi:hypothetical protein